MHTIGSRLEKWFFGQTQLSESDRSRARLSLLVFGLYFLISLLDGLCQSFESADAVQGDVILSQGLWMLLMLTLLKLTGRFKVLVALHLIVSQMIACWSMHKSGWTFDPMLVHLPVRVIIASYFVGVRRSAGIGLLLAGSCYAVLMTNSELLPTGTALVFGTWRMAINAFIAVAVTSLFAEYYSESLQKQSEEISQNQDRTFRLARYHRLGHMLGELNHHINNPLAILEASFYRLRTLRDQAPRAQAEKEYLLQPIEQSIRRIFYIVNDLQLISRMDQSEIEQIESVRNICKNLLLATEDCCTQHRVHLQFTDLTQNMNFICRPYQLTRILSAIVTNACEAVATNPGAVGITIGVRHDQIEFHVIDSGPGVPKDLENKLFEPFFTTKPTHSHAGLSLATSRNILEKQGGALTYQAKREGTSFRICLPLKIPQQQGVA